MTARAAWRTIAAVLALGLAGCGGADDPTEQLDEGKPVGEEEVPKVMMSWVRHHGRRRYESTGPITYCTDPTSAARQQSVDRFNALYNGGGPGVTLKMMPTDTWRQFDEFAKHRDECDVFDADVIATGALAAREWVRDMHHMS